MIRNVLLLLLVCLIAAPVAAQTTLRFSGYEWRVKSGDKMGPGPNAWSKSNVWVDKDGYLHLKISRQLDKWYCAEVGMTQRLGFGTYEFEIAGPIDRLDRNVVLGLFNYPTREIGPDGTNEIDIEFAQWGNATYPNGNFTVWPAKPGVKQTSETFRFTLTGKEKVIVSRFNWRPDGVLYDVLQNGTSLGRWDFRPDDAVTDRVPQKPLPVLLNLWLFRGVAPADGKEVEIVIKRFRFTPAARS
jgi:hypothetical protein